jgi:hypothetical protein
MTASHDVVPAISLARGAGELREPELADGAAPNGEAYHLDGRESGRDGAVD